MAVPAKPELQRVAASIADGLPVDWDALSASADLTPEEIRALRILETVGRRTSTGEPGGSLPGGFELLGELGRGSVGSVWRAFDRSLEREVALKVIEAESPASSPSARARERFLEEARLLASLRHPNIVQIHSVEEHEGSIRLVLERIEGRNLAEIVHGEGPLAPAEAARIGIELCHALAALHARGIVHRDLKPTNVMRETGGRIVLLDFGVARSDSSRRPVTSASAGTPRFMAPEQFEARGEIGPAADLWALGALLYWLASASFPFEGHSYEELERSVLEGRSIPLVDRVPDVPAAFAQVLRRALERDPSRRSKSAGEMELELRAFLAGGAPVGSASAPTASASARARHTWKWMGPALAVVVLGVLGWYLRPARAPLVVEWELYALRSGQDVRLRSGDATRVGDLLALELSAAEDLFVYVLDEDDTGETHVLFPVPGFETGNPLAAGKVHQLPGSWRGQSQNWLVTSTGGGAENILIVASRGPFAPLEQLISGLPKVQPDAAAVYPQVTHESRGLLLRGIGGTRSEPDIAPAAASGGRLAILNQVFALLERASSPDRNVQLIRLVHGGG